MDNPASNLRSVNDQCTWYRDVCGLPAVPSDEGHRIIVRAGRVGAMTMDRGLGRLVDNLLEQAPVIEHFRSGSWCFLVRTDHAIGREQQVHLYRHNVSFVETGAEIALPARDDTHRGWVRRPASSYRPSTALMLRCLDDAIAEARRNSYA